MMLTPLPSWLDEVGKLLREKKYTCDGLNHVLVNEYHPGQGISPHEDGPLYTPHFAIISLLSGLCLNFYKKLDDDAPSSLEERFFKAVYLEPGSALIISNSAYTDFLHGIEEVEEDVVSEERVANFHLLTDESLKGQTVPRRDRISLTIRHVKKTIKVSKLFGAKK
jgi:alkylated DNA repair protein alkB family protein 6